MHEIGCASKSERCESQIEKKDSHHCSVDELNEKDFHHCSVDELNDDVLLCIFSKLSIIDQFIFRRVCKKWKNLFDYLLENRSTLVIGSYSAKIKYEKYTFINVPVKLSYKDFVWDALKQKCGHRILDETTLKHIFVKCPNLKILYINDSEIDIDNQIIDIIYEYCPKKLENIILDLEHSRVKDVILHAFVLKLGHNLKYVQLEGKFNEDFIKYLIKSAPNLETFIYLPEDDGSLTGECYSYFQDNLKQISLCHTISSSDSINSLCQSNCKNLKCLHLPTEINTYMVKAIVKNFKMLTDIRLNCKHVSDIRNLVVIAKLTNLEILSLRFPEVNCDIVLIEIMRACSKLKQLCIYDSIFTDDSIMFIGDFCPLIQDLTLVLLYPLMIEKLTDYSLNCITRLSKLKKFSVHNAHYITDNGLIKVLKECHLIEKFVVGSCRRITNDFLYACIKEAELHPSKHLRLVICLGTRINNKTIKFPKNLTVIV